MKATSPSQSQVDALAAKLESGEIAKMEVFQIPARVLTRTRITPEALEKQFHYKLTIREIRGGAYQPKLIEAKRSLVVKPASEIPDVRWGVVFYGPDDARVVALYFDKSGSSGAVDGTAVSFTGSLFEWLNSSFSSCFR